MKKQLKAMRLNPELIKNVDKIAKSEKRSFTNMVEVILTEYVKENKAA